MNDDAYAVDMFMRPCINMGLTEKIESGKKSGVFYAQPLTSKSVKCLLTNNEWFQH